MKWKCIITSKHQKDKPKTLSISGRQPGWQRATLSTWPTFGSRWGSGDAWCPAGPPWGRSASWPHAAGTGQTPAPCSPCTEGCTSPAHPGTSRTSPWPAKQGRQRKTGGQRRRQDNVITATVSTGLHGRPCWTPSPNHKPPQKGKERSGTRKPWTLSVVSIGQECKTNCTANNKQCQSC